MTVKNLRLLAGLLVVNGLLLGATWIAQGGVGAPWYALEAGLLVGFFWMLPRTRRTRALAGVAAALLVVSAVILLADAAARLSLARPLNLYLDLYLAGSVFDLLVGTLGPLLAGAALLAAALGAVLLGLLVWRLLAPSRPGPEWPVERHVGTLLVLVFLVGMLLPWIPGPRPPQLQAVSRAVDTPAITMVVEQTRGLTMALGERERFWSELAARPPAPTVGLLSGLDGRDVLLGFIESYGVSALEDPRYAAVIQPRLDDMGRRVSDAGLHMATGLLVAPTQGGQSWFSHGSLLSGLWLDNQLRYDLLLASGTETLIDDFRRAGYRTVALMPAITAAWPEGERLGYDQIYSRDEISYRGPPLNWVTMPDQFTWSFLEHRVRAAGGPLFAEVGLISSHAPWTPILPVLDDWESIGDGAIFGPWENSGERPEELWLDTERVREHYALSVEYALHAMIGYAERYLDGRTLLIVLGDHQPAPLITGEEASRAVPVHVISGDSALVQPFLKWGFRSGPFPDPAARTPRMDEFRDWFLRAYSEAWPGAHVSSSSTAFSTFPVDHEHLGGRPAEPRRRAHE